MIFGAIPVLVPIYLLLVLVYYYYWYQYYCRRRRRVHQSHPRSCPRAPPASLRPLGSARNTATSVRSWCLFRRPYFTALSKRANYRIKVCESETLVSRIPQRLREDGMVQEPDCLQVQVSENSSGVIKLLLTQHWFAFGAGSKTKTEAPLLQVGIDPRPRA